MSTLQIVLLVAGILFIQALTWIMISRWVKRRTEAIKSRMYKQYCSGNGRFIIEPKSALYRGADTWFGNVKGNGVICLTENSLIFEKITGQKIELNRVEIIEVTVEDWFKGKPSFATGGKHLVIKAKDGNRIGFLVRNAEQWSEKLNLR
jgi:hypothetical protein